MEGKHFLMNSEKELPSMSDITRGVVTLVDDNKKCQALQTELSLDEVLDGVEHVQPFGLSFRPDVETECIIATLNSDPGNCVAFGVTDRANRPKGLTEPGTGGLYYKGEYKVFIDANGVVHLGAKEGEDFVALANKVLDELEKIREQFNKHTHETTATIGDTVDPGVISEPSPQIAQVGSVSASRAKAF